MSSYGAHFKNLKKAKTDQRTGFQNIQRAMNAKKAGKKIPSLIFPAFLIVCIGVGLYLHENPGELDMLEKLDIGFFTTAIAVESGQKAPEKTEGAAKTAAPKAVDASLPAEPSSQWTKEEIALFRKLAARKSELDRREEELNKLDEDLQRQRVDVDKRLQELSGLREKIAQQLKDRVEQDQTRVDKLVQVYSSMKPQSAAKVVETINEDLAVEVLTKMKQKNAAEILNLLPADKSQRLSEKFAGYKRD
jgi:flagellar motility protein MotE (MotC chaperone)